MVILIIIFFLTSVIPLMAVTPLGMVTLWQPIEVFLSRLNIGLLLVYQETVTRVLQDKFSRQY